VNAFKKKNSKKGKAGSKIAYSTQVDTNNDVDYYGDKIDSDEWDAKLSMLVLCMLILSQERIQEPCGLVPMQIIPLDVTRICNKQFSVNGVTGNAVGSRMGWFPCFGAAVITPEIVTL
jgi:hypothetical protein